MKFKFEIRERSGGTYVPVQVNSNSNKSQFEMLCCYYHHSVIGWNPISKSFVVIIKCHVTRIVTPRMATRITCPFRKKKIYIYDFEHETGGNVFESTLISFGEAIVSYFCWWYNSGSFNIWVSLGSNVVLMFITAYYEGSNGTVKRTLWRREFRSKKFDTGCRIRYICITTSSSDSDENSVKMTSPFQSDSFAMLHAAI